MCDCIKTMNDALKERNIEIVVNLIGPERAYVETHILTPKRGFRRPMLQASFCPFCGEKYLTPATSTKRTEPPE